MGLLDVLNGMKNDPSGQESAATSSGSMSPITMAVLGYLAYRGVTHFSSSSGNAGDNSAASSERAEYRAEVSAAFSAGDSAVFLRAVVAEPHCRPDSARCLSNSSKGAMLNRPIRGPGRALTRIFPNRNSPSQLVRKISKRSASTPEWAGMTC
jgi:hypothetical protein